MSRQVEKKEYIASWLRIDEFEEDVMTGFTEKSTMFDDNPDDDYIEGDDDNLW